jgi:hypothetical protein
MARMKLGEELEVFRASLRICCVRIYSYLDKQELGRLLFLPALVMFCLSPTLFDTALTLQYLGYDAVMVLIEIQFAAIAVFLSARLITPLKFAVGKWPFRKGGEHE